MGGGGEELDTYPYYPSQFDVHSKKKYIFVSPYAQSSLLHDLVKAFSQIQFTYVTTVISHRKSK